MLSLESTTMPPVGKSGPLTHFRSVFDFASGSGLCAIAALQAGATEATGTDTYEYNRNLVLTDGQAFRQGLIPSAITKLTPEEAAAIPPKDRPGR